jgi:ribonuclease R
MKKKVSKQPEIATGVIRIHPRGFGFLIPDAREMFPEDVFIPRHATLGAVDGDYVEVSVNVLWISEKGPEGRVAKILRRGRSHLAGIVSYVGKKEQIYAYVPLLGEDQSMRIIPSDERQLKVGDRIIIHVKDWGGKKRNPLGEMSSYIGHISDPSCDIAAAIEEFELTSDFPESALEEAKAFGTHVSTADLKQREDLRSLNCLTIDPDTAKDFDDALSLKQEKDGTYYLGVHIADVSHYVKPESALDFEARQRCNSVYFPGSVLPMLPHQLSSHLCSLKAGVNRLTISVFVTIDAEGNVLDYQIKRSVIRSKKRFTYKEAKNVLDGIQTSPFASDLALMVKLCMLLKKKRALRGCIEFTLPDLSLDLDDTGHVKKVSIVEYDISHQLVEEFMLLANEIVATHMGKQGKPLAYRIHEEPNVENIRDFAQTASSIGFKIPPNPTAEELQALFDEARQTPFGQFLATAFIRSMKLASYSTQNIGHYGLGLEYYTHFTSPIRRYIDLIVHRALFNEHADAEALEDQAVKCSEKERLSAKAEASVILLKKLRYLEARRQKKVSVYEAVIVTIKPFGFFFELKEILYEGFLPLPDLSLEIGSKIVVRLEAVDLVTRQTDWTLITPLPKKKGKQQKLFTQRRKKQPKRKNK